MQDHAENTKRIAKNTLMLYGRMLFSMVVSLYTSRVVLNTLGVVDYGIYGVVGGFVAMFSLISSSLSSAVSRFLTFELGRGDKERLNKAFSTSLLIHIVLAIVVFIVAETVGVWFVNNKMTIPADRLYAANWVFQASILSFMFGLFSVPYNASIVSHEKMSAFAYIGILDTMLKLFVVLFIANSSWSFDRLIVYAVLLVVVSVLLQCIYLFYCRRHFEECNLRINFDKSYWREISSFAGWNFIGCTATLLKDQGVNVLMNLFFGPVVNAARSIAYQVNGAVMSFVNNFMTAMNPQITKSYACNDEQYSILLVEKGARFSYYILFILSLPILLETEFILKVWLCDYPSHTISFVRLVIVLSLIDVLSSPLTVLISATGRIKKYQLVVGCAHLSIFPLSYLFFKLQCPPEFSYYITIIMSFVCLILRLYFLKELVGVSVIFYVRRVVFNVAAVSIVSFTIPGLIYLSMDYGEIRFLIVLLSSVILNVISIFCVGCSRDERKYISNYLKKKRNEA